MLTLIPKNLKSQNDYTITLDKKLGFQNVESFASSLQVNLTQHYYTIPIKSMRSSKLPDKTEHLIMSCLIIEVISQ